MKRTNEVTRIKFMFIMYAASLFVTLTYREDKSTIALHLSLFQLCSDEIKEISTMLDTFNVT